MLLFCLPVWLHAQVPDPLQRFFEQPAASVTLIPDMPPVSAPERTPVAPEVHNQGVAHNNDGLAAMQRSDPTAAIASFRQAVQCNPGEIAFRHNLALALKRSGNAAEALTAWREVMGLAPTDPQAPYSAGLVLLNQLHRPQEAVAYFRLALQLNPADHIAAVNLAEAYQKLGMRQQAIDLLKQHAHLVSNDGYPLCLLGNLLCETDQYPEAIRALTSASQLDNEGFAHEALIRARFHGGQLAGLADLCRAVLGRFTRLQNRKAIEHIYAVLSPQQYRLTETLALTMNQPDAVTDLSISVRLLPSFERHQRVKLADIALVTPTGARRNVQREAISDGRIRLTLAKEDFFPKLQVRLEHLVDLEPTLAEHGSLHRYAVPSLDAWVTDPRLSLDLPLLNQLAKRIAQLPGEFAANAYTVVGRGFRYRENFEDHNVAWAFANPDRVDCTEFATVFAAVCLLRGIPARTVTGFLVKDELIGTPTEVGHAWAEIFVKDRGWLPADPTLGRTMRWAYFGNLLSDQIIFDAAPGRPRPRVSINYMAREQTAQVKIESSMVLERR